MKGKPKPDEYRMKAPEFDAMVRRALGAPPLQEQKPKAVKKTKKKATPKK
ncbi:MAG: hypothetical protein MN733_16980 [Nitrososphaera sp.]|nr:hypothetical protein [Nitrososphaera sp.]